TGVLVSYLTETPVIRTCAYPAKLRGLPAPAEVARLTFARRAQGERDTRVARVAPGGSRLRFHLRLPAHPVFRAGLGIALPKGAGAPAAPDASASELRFHVRVRPRLGFTRVVLDERLRAADLDG